MRFKTVEEDVTKILKEDEAARCDDMALYANYAYGKLANRSYGAGWLQMIFSNRRFRIMHGIAPYETVSRIRRKLQEEHEDLRPSEAYRQERKRIEAEYKKYAKQKGGGANE